MLALNNPGNSANSAIVAVFGGMAENSFAEGVSAFKRGDFVIALNEFRKAADEGNADAQYNLGIMYDNGHGVPPNGAEAQRWYRSAAEQGNVDAQFNLAESYKCGHGHGVEHRSGEAVRWFRAAAEQGDAPAMFNLGIMYQCGEGDMHDNAFACMCFRLALSKMACGGKSEKMLRINAMAAKAMTPEEKTESAELEREWIELYG